MAVPVKVARLFSVTRMFRKRLSKYLSKRLSKSLSSHPSNHPWSYLLKYLSSHISSHLYSYHSIYDSNLLFVFLFSLKSFRFFSPFFCDFYSTD